MSGESKRPSEPVDSGEADVEQYPERPSTPPKSGNRRNSPRIAIEAEIGLHTETQFFTGFTEDISEGGIFIATYNMRPVGTHLTVTFGLPGGFEITAEGHVAWLREPQGLRHDMSPGMGIAFESMSDPARDAIHRFLQHRAPLFYEL